MLLNKIFLAHSCVKKEGRSIITADEFLKILKNLNLCPELIKIFKAKKIICNCARNNCKNKAINRSINSNSTTFLKVNFDVYMLVLEEIASLCFSGETKAPFNCLIKYIQKAARSHYAVTLTTQTQFEAVGSFDRSNKQRKSVNVESFCDTLSNFIKTDLLEDDSYNTPRKCETQSKFVLFKPKNLDEGISKCSMDIHFHSAVAFNDIYPIAESFNEEEPVDTCAETDNAFQLSKNNLTIKSGFDISKTPVQTQRIKSSSVDRKCKTLSQSCSKVKHSKAKQELKYKQSSEKKRINSYSSKYNNIDMIMSRNINSPTNEVKSTKKMCILLCDSVIKDIKSSKLKYKKGKSYKISMYF